ncbi:hypothetical protein HZB07_02050 [Candidatus Saganbacteria bacterium]|nr:hypothetical protein [Candidatus Saganbacteria bacterium]
MIKTGQKRILFITNGFAEDMVGAELARELLKLEPQLSFFALPIVGHGEPYQQLNIPLIGPHWDLPSQGITYGPDFDVWREIRAGAIQLYLGKIWALFWFRRRADLVIGVGDFLSSVISGLLVKKPYIYVWTMASHFDNIAKHYLKKYAVMIFCRFPQWEHLPEFPVEWVGNPLLDMIETTGETFGLDKNFKTIGVLPGSRVPAYNNLPILIETLAVIAKQQPVNIVFAISPKIDREKFISLAKAQPHFSDRIVFTDKFGDVLNVSDLVLGLSASGNEQAAGLGKPLVTFWGGGHISRSEEFVKWHTKFFMKGSTAVVPPDAKLAAEKVLSLLSDPAKMQEMSDIGIKTNGGKGALSTIAKRIITWLKQN